MKPQIQFQLFSNPEPASHMDVLLALNVRRNMNPRTTLHLQVVSMVHGLMHQDVNLVNSLAIYLLELSKYIHSIINSIEIELLVARCKHLPKAPRNGMVIAPKTEHGMKARFTCRDGFNLAGHNVTECQYGEWIGDPPMCNQSNINFAIVFEIISRQPASISY